MDLIYLAYAPSEEEPLAALKKEEEEVYNILKDREILDNHYTVTRPPTATAKTLIADLTDYKSKMCIFHYSGHADSNSLLIEGKEAQAKGISNLLIECPNIKLVVLNGCSTKGQVQRLLNETGEKGVPVVIATSRPVNDQAANQFAITFYKELVERFSSIKDAFKTAMDAVEILEKVEYDSPTTRGVIDRVPTTDTPLWGIYCRKKEYSLLDWTLPGTYKQAAEPDFTLNKYLYKAIFVGLANHRKEVHALRKKEEELGRYLESIPEKDKMVIRSLPHTISEQLRILRSKSDNGSKDGFDKFGKNRLKQLFRTYDATLQLLVFMLLAQFWDLYKATDTDMTIEESETAVFLSIFQKQDSPEESRYEALFKFLMEKLLQTNAPFFLKELKKTTNHFHLNESFLKACRNIEANDRNVDAMEEKQVIGLCVSVERDLADLFIPILFITNYRLTSVKSISVKKQRHLDYPNYLHTVIDLEHDILTFDQNIEYSEYLMDDSSVVLCRCKLDSTGSKIQEEFSDAVENKIPHYLTVSPFLYDQNAEDEESPMPFILYFNGVEKETKEFLFSPIYDSDYKPKKITKKDAKTIYSQFETFCQLVFKKPLAEAL